MEAGEGEGEEGDLGEEGPFFILRVGPQPCPRWSLQKGQ